MKDYFLRIARNIALVMLALWICIKVYDRMAYPGIQHLGKKTHWSNIDTTKSPSDVKSYNYSTGTVEYREEGPYMGEFKYESESTAEDIIHDSAIEVEDLIEIYRD